MGVVIIRHTHASAHFKLEMFQRVLTVRGKAVRNTFVCITWGSLYSSKIL